MSQFQLRKAERKQAKLRIGLSGPSGAGKTYSAILLASGLTDMTKVAMIDTESGRGELYSHLGDYNYIRLEAPYSPERYIQAIKACEDEGMEVIIIDSIAHEWEGEGGCLEINETLANTKYKGNSWAAWNETTPRHRKFIDKIVNSKAHIITCVRNKIDTIQTEDKKIKKVGVKEITREGFEYELTVNFNIDRDTHFATPSKDNTELFENEEPHKISKQTGEKLIKWANDGKKIKPTDEQTATFMKQLEEFGITENEWYEKMKSQTNGKPWASLSEEAAQDILDRQEKRLEEKRLEKQVEEAMEEPEKKDDDQDTPSAPPQEPETSPVSNDTTKTEVKTPVEQKLESKGAQMAKKAFDETQAKLKEKEEKKAHGTEELTDEIKVEDVPF